MPFDPTLPQEDTPLDAAQMRDQFNALHDEIADANAQIAALSTALAAAIAGTAQNPNLSPVSIAVSEPPTRAEFLVLLDAFNTLLNQITRV